MAGPLHRDPKLMSAKLKCINCGEWIGFKLKYSVLSPDKRKLNVHCALYSMPSQEYLKCITGPADCVWYVHAEVYDGQFIRERQPPNSGPYYLREGDSFEVKFELTFT